MALAHPEYKNILIIHFGQLGDVVLGMPALRAIREHFPDSTITVMSGTSTAAFIGLAKVADKQIAVDRVKLRDGKRLTSLAEMGRIVRDVRRRRFDLVIDLHSLYETNVVGFLSGAGHRLFANRDRRSFDRLSNFPVKPPAEDRSKHAAERYLDVIRPLGIDISDAVLQLEPDKNDLDHINKLFAELGIGNESLVGMFLGAGHQSRRWPVEKYAELAARIVNETRARVLVFLGPEELDLLPAVKEQFPPSAIILDKLKLLPLFAALTFLDILVSNDTGPTHLAAATNAHIVLITHAGAPQEFLPLTDRLDVINSGTIAEIGVDEVYFAVRQRLK